MHTIFLLLTVTAATAVEIVEALTIVIAVGATRGWRSALEGAFAAIVAISAIAIIFGAALVNWVPVDQLRIVVGSLLLVFGLQWLRKAVLRASGYKSLHDEEVIYEKNVRQLTANRTAAKGFRDTFGFVVSFKGVFLEGLEVIVIVISFGASSGRLGLATIGAIGTTLILGTLGLIIAKPLSKVPENTIKFAVGIVLTTFGTFWTVEGSGVGWPGGDLFIIALLALYAVISMGMVLRLKQAKGSLSIKEQAKVTV